MNLEPRLLFLSLHMCTGYTLHRLLFLSLYPVHYVEGKDPDGGKKPADADADAVRRCRLTSG